ncbi:hypothetical protein INR49_002265 [Caranx melampygus]|nr:hypothetical protein INR49_002265 [Caranx melampygus]
MAGLGKFLQTLVQSVLMAGPGRFLQTLVQSVLMAGPGKFLQTLVQSVLMAGPDNFLQSLVQSVLMAGLGKFLQTLVQSVLMAGPGRFLQTLVQSVLCAEMLHASDSVLDLASLSSSLCCVLKCSMLRSDIYCRLDFGIFCSFWSFQDSVLDLARFCTGPGKSLVQSVLCAEMLHASDSVLDLASSKLCHETLYNTSSSFNCPVVNWPDTTEHIQPPALIKVKDAWEQDLKMFLNTVLVVLTDLAARLLGNTVFRQHFHLLLSAVVMLSPTLNFWVSQHSIFAKKSHFLYRIFLRSGWGWTCVFVGSFVFLLSFSIRRSLALSVPGMLWRGYEVSEDVFLLCLCCLLLAEEMAVFGPYLSLGGISDAPLRILFLFCVLLLSLWIFLLFCILAYFPQFPTQLLGGALGCLSWRGLYQGFYRMGPSWYCPGGLEWDCSTPRPAVLKLNMHY